MLDDFSHTRIDSKKPDVSSGPGRSSAVPSAPAPDSGLADEANLEDDLSDDDFAKQLQAGMANLLGEMENSVRFTAVATGVLS
jgi:peroxin-19